MLKKIFLLVIVIFFSLGHTYGGFFINPEKESLLYKVFLKDGNYHDVTINGIHFFGTRPWIIRWNMIKDACNYSGLKVLDLGCFVGLNSVCIKKYCGAKAVTGVDFMKSYANNVAWLAKAFEVSVDFKYADFNDPACDYEHSIGTDYDVVFCLSLLFWVYDPFKDRFLSYLSQFKKIIFEGHESAAVEIARFKKLGFDAKILGVSENGRTLIFFSK